MKIDDVMSPMENRLCELNRLWSRLARDIFVDLTLALCLLGTALELDCFAVAVCCCFYAEAAYRLGACLLPGLLGWFFIKAFVSWNAGRQKRNSHKQRYTSYLASQIMAVSSEKIANIMPASNLGVVPSLSWRPGTTACSCRCESSSTGCAANYFAWLELGRIVVIAGDS